MPMRDTAKLSLAFPYATPLNKSLQWKHAFSIIARVVEFGRVLYNYSVESPKP